MAAFNPLADRITVLRGLEHPGCISAGGHQTGDSFLTGSHVNRAAKSPSFDQIASMTHGHKTRYPSLVLGNEGGMGSIGLSKTLSYNQFGRPIPASNDIRGLFDAMFNSDPQLQKRQRSRLASDKHRLDHVLESYHGLKRQLGRDDSQKLDQYMQALRDVEKEIQRMQRWVATPKPQVPNDGLALNASDLDEDLVSDTLNVILKYEGDIKKAQSELGRLIVRKADEATTAGKTPEEVEKPSGGAAPPKKGVLH